MSNNLLSLKILKKWKSWMIFVQALKFASYCRTWCFGTIVTYFTLRTQPFLGQAPVGKTYLMKLMYLCEFMKATKITNANLVELYFLDHQIWRNTFTAFMKATKITNANLVVNHFLLVDLWRYTSGQYTKAIRTSDVNLVGNYFLKANI